VMGTSTIFKALEKRIRLSKSYHDWVIRNKGHTCICCGATTHLECHHVVELYHVIFGLWKLYGNQDKIYAHVIAMHDDDHCEAATMCDKCHSGHHPSRKIPNSDVEVHTDSWTVLPRNLELHLCQSTQDKTPGNLGLIGFQTLLGIGWYILNGHMNSRIITFNRRRFAELIDKNPSSSFNRSFDTALHDLKTAGVLLTSHRAHNDTELHLNGKYLDLLADNPWFMPLEDVKTSNPCVLMLQWFLGMQSNRARYRISLQKLTNHIGIKTCAPQMAVKAIRIACGRIKWAKVCVDKGMCTFSLKRRGSTPVFSLRQILEDSIQKGR